MADMDLALGFTRARLTQRMALLLVAPEVQEDILVLEIPPGAQPVSELGLREEVLGTIDGQEQRRRWEGLKATFQQPSPRSASQPPTAKKSKLGRRPSPRSA